MVLNKREEIKGDNHLAFFRFIFRIVFGYYSSIATANKIHLVCFSQTQCWRVVERVEKKQKSNAKIRRR